uniref:Uncharacterized protein n=1 Tax=Tanacetum cinerariifolium TaxID=118510 RepID=A0A699L8Q4_TANCI|nr:hypothetical protein [Tanacetum cinerariifolium]
MVFPCSEMIALYGFLQMYDRLEDERLCVFLLEKKSSKLRDGKEEILGMFDLRCVILLRRLGQVFSVDAPFVFHPSYGS